MPQRTLPVPLRRTLSAVQLRSAALPAFEISADWAFSSVDQNRLSSAASTVQESQAWGVAATTIPLELFGTWTWDVSGRMRGRGATFQTFERIRDVDFLRQWNLPLVAGNPTGALIDGQDEQERRLASRLSGPDSTGLEGSWQRLRLGAAIEAERFDGRIRLSPLSGWSVDASGAHVASEGVLPSAFSTTRSTLDTRVAWTPESGRWQPWAAWERERYDGSDPTGSFPAGLERRIPMDALRAGFDRTGQRWMIGAQVEERREKVRPGSTLVPLHIRTVQTALDWQPSQRWRTALTGGWRSSTALSSPDASAGKAAADRSIILAWNGQGSPTQGHRIRWKYDVRAEQTAAQQEIYLRTGPERGAWVWVDSNGDGVVQEDEFLPESVPGEGEYARVLFPTDSLESVTTASASLGYEYAPQQDTPALLRFSWRSQWEVSETSRHPDRSAVARLRPALLQESGQTINGRIRVQQQVGLAPLNTRRDVDVSLLWLRSLAELASGSQETRLRENRLRWRESVSKRWDMTGEARWSSDGSTSARFTSRTWRIRRLEWQPGVVFKPGRWRFQGRWVRAIAEESASSSRASIHRIPLEALLGGRKWSWRGGLEWSSAEVSGGRAVGMQLFELTEGRGAGTSWLWNLRLDARLTDVVTATIRYDGRNPDGLRAIHTGNMQLTARF